MANSNDPFNNGKKPENNSFIKASTVAAPTFLGVGLATRNVLGEAPLSARNQSALEDVITRAKSVSTKIPDLPSIKEQLDFMSRNVDPSIARTAWQQAMRGVDPLTRDRLLTYARDIDMIPENEIYPSIEQTFLNKSSKQVNRLYQTFYRNVKDLSRQTELMGGMVPKFANMGDNIRLNSKFSALPDNIATRVQSIAGALGADYSPTRLTRAGWEEAGFGVYNVVFRGTSVGDISLHIPEIVDGMTVQGNTLQTRYIAPSVGIFDPVTQKMTEMSRSEFFLKEVEESILPDVGTRLKTKRDVDKAIGQAYGRIFGELETAPNVRPELITQGQRRYERLRAQAVDVLVARERELYDGAPEYMSAFRQPTEEELGKAMRSAGLSGGTSPTNLAKGRVTRANFGEMSIVPEAIDYGRRPEQAIREWTLTEEAAANMNRHSRYAKYRAFESEGQRQAEKMLMNPNVRAMYIDPAKFGGVMENLAMGEGEAIARRGLTSDLEFESLRTVKLKTLREDLVGNIQNAVFNEGEVIGEDETGKLFKFRGGMEFLGAEEFETRGQGGFVSLSYRDMRRFQHGDKVFGDVKALALLRDESSMSAYQKVIAGQLATDEAVDMFVSMDELRKNRQLFNKQIITELGDALGNRPDLAARQFSKNAVINGVYSNEEFVRQTMKFAVQEAKVTPEQFGRIFGAAPTVLGEKSAEALAREFVPESAAKAYVTAMNQGVSFGVAKIAYGGPAELTGAGAMGSVEPRVFDIMKSQGPLSTAVADDIAMRAAGANTAAVTANIELGKTLQSIAGQLTPGKGDKVLDMTKPGQRYNRAAFQDAIEEGGSFFFKARPDAPAIYVPGSDVLDAMRPFETSGSQVVRGQLSQEFHDLAAKLSYAGADETEKILQGAAGTFTGQFAPGGKGMGAFARSKLPGSRFLRGVSEVGGKAIEEANVVGIAPEQFGDMVREMNETGLYDRKAMDNMAKRFYAGQDVGGYLGRHPFIGQYSVQPVMFRRMEGAGDLMVIPERVANIRVANEAGDVTEKALRLGPLVGMAGDKDADIFSAMLMSPDNEKAVRKMSMQADNEFARRYTQHQVRMQLFKAGKARGETGMDTIAEMIAESQKLGTGQKWIAPLSTELSGAKEALTKFGKGAASADARFLLEWLEQTPISAKHMSASQAADGGLRDLMQTITSSIRNKNAKRLNLVVGDIVKNDSVAGAMLTGNLQIQSGADEIASIMNIKMDKQLKGINIDSATKELMRSIEASELAGEGRMSQVLSGRASRVKISEIPEIVARGTAQAMKTQKGVFSAVSSAATTASNRMGALGAAITKHHKPIGLGFAASIALSAVLSDPAETIGPGAGTIPDSSMLFSQGKAANRMKPEDIQPPGQTMGSPTVPASLHQETVRIQSGAPTGRQYYVKGQMPAGVSGAAVAGQIAGAGGNGNVHVNLRNSTSNILPHEIADRLS